MFNCDKFNKVESTTDTNIVSNVFIKHLKSTGRYEISGVKENLLGA